MLTKIQKIKLNVCDLKFDYPREKGDKISTIKINHRYHFDEVTPKDIALYLQKLKLNKKYRDFKTFNNVTCVLNDTETECYLQTTTNEPRSYSWWLQEIRYLKESEKDMNWEEMPMDLDIKINHIPLPTNSTKSQEHHEKLLTDQISLLFLLLDTKLEALTLILLNYSQKLGFTEEIFSIIVMKTAELLEIFSRLTQDKSPTEVINQTQNSKLSHSDIISLVNQIKDDLSILQQEGIHSTTYKTGLVNHNDYEVICKKIKCQLIAIQHHFVLLKIQAHVHTHLNSSADVKPNMI